MGKYIDSFFTYFPGFKLLRAPKFSREIKNVIDLGLLAVYGITEYAGLPKGYHQLVSSMLGNNVTTIYQLRNEFYKRYKDSNYLVDGPYEAKINEALYHYTEVAIKKDLAHALRFIEVMDEIKSLVNVVPENSLDHIDLTALMTDGRSMFKVENSRLH